MSRHDVTRRIAALDPERDHARILLTETSLRLREIVDITGLDIYQVVGLKLSLRPGSRNDHAAAPAGR